MTRTFGVLLLTLALPGALYIAACSSDALSAFNADSGEPRSDAGAGAAFGDASNAPASGDLAPADNAVILVHAAKTPSFRLCFLNELDRLPQPDSQAMPEANVVGVEVGSAVRIGPLRGVPGKAYLFSEATIRSLYPVFDGTPGTGPSCDVLLHDARYSPSATEIGDIETNLSQGVHLLVVKGCSADTMLDKYSLAQCGDDWTSDAGNLEVQEISLMGAQRTSADALPAQVVNLSGPLERARAGRDVVVSFGDVGDGGAPQAEIAVNPPVFGGAVPVSPVQLSYASSDLATYDSTGFRVEYGSTDAGAPPARLLTASLARVQKLSSPRDLPPSYYAAASNYALLLLGDPAPTLTDGGPDDDERRNLHLLAVPVIAPKGDAGAEDGGGAADDGGT